MENIEIDDSEFYQQDFTTASEWEIFIARLEELLHEWKLTQNQQSANIQYSNFSNGTWETNSDTLFFADVEFVLRHYYLSVETREEGETIVDGVEDEEDDAKHAVLEELQYNGDDFPQIPVDKHPPLIISRMYGLKNFLVVTPAKHIDVDNESKIKILLSSVQIAVNNANCEIPIFVQVREYWQNCYLGVCEGRGLRTNFDMIHLQKGPQHCKYLTGLLDMFKTKIGGSKRLDVVISVQFSYNLNNWGSGLWTQEPHLWDLLHEDEVVNIEDLSVLPFGANCDPVNDMTLITTWENISECMVMDSENYSDFSPTHGNFGAFWSIKVKMADLPVCLLSECATEFLQLVANHASIQDMLSDYIVDNPEIPNALSKISESKVPSMASVLKRAGVGAWRRSSIAVSIIPPRLLSAIINYLFPAASDTKHAYKTEFEMPCDAGALKSCGYDSLLWRLTLIMAHGVHSFGGVKTFIHIWYEFVHEMRSKWDKSTPIRGLNQGFPDSRTCLLHQKLQLLNCCIERKLKRETQQLTGNTMFDEETHSTDSDDEFFDCDSEENPEARHALWNQPTGRLSKYGDMRLLQTGDPLYVPVTQEAVPKTEDQQEEDENIIVQLGNDAIGSELRARLMSPSLLSDMESFKAANPGAILEDFIRWYSPRDWIEDKNGEKDQWGQIIGQLSSRMLLPDNTWVVIWESAQPVPARRQKRLFDDTSEAEKILFYLESRTVSQVVELLLPVMTHVALTRLVHEGGVYRNEVRNLNDRLRHLVNTAQRISRDPRLPPRLYEKLYQEMAVIEGQIAQAKSLRSKFCPKNGNDGKGDNEVDEEEIVEFLAGLLENREMRVPGGPTGPLAQKITNIFTDVQRATQLLSDSFSTTSPSGPGEAVSEDATNEDTSLVTTSSSTCPFPRPCKKEFVLRTKAPRPVSHSGVTPQFLRAVLTHQDFQLAGAFTQDTLFFS